MALHGLGELIVRPPDVHEDFDTAKLSFGWTARQLGAPFRVTLATMWSVEIPQCDQDAFLELARECAKNHSWR